jgi:hypothetical protein
MPHMTKAPERQIEKNTSCSTEVYGRVVPDFLREAIDTLKLGAPVPVATQCRKSGDRDASRGEKQPASEVLGWRALLDSNQWPSASETDALSN